VDLLVQGVVGDLPGDEVAIERVSPLDDRPDEGVGGELVDASWPPLGGLEDASDGLVADEPGVGVGVREVVPDVVAGVLQSEGTERLGVDDARAQRLELGVAESAEQVLGAGDEDGEVVLGVEVVAGEASQGVQDGDGEPLGVVDEDDGVRPLLGGLGGETLLDGVEQVAGVSGVPATCCCSCVADWPPDVAGGPVCGARPAGSIRRARRATA